MQESNTDTLPCCEHAVGRWPGFISLHGVESEPQNANTGEADEGVFRVASIFLRLYMLGLPYNMHGVLPQEVFKTSRWDVFGYSGIDL